MLYTSPAFPTLAGDTKPSAETGRPKAWSTGEGKAEDQKDLKSKPTAEAYKRGLVDVQST